MLIQCTLRRAGGTRIAFNNDDGSQAEYHFAPDATLPNEPHVCKVENDAHLHRLLTIPEAYRIYVALGTQAPKIEAPPISAIQPAPPAPAVEPDSTPPPNKVAALRALSVRELKATINTYSIDDLRAALALELADSEPRKTWVEIVQAQVGE